MPEMPSTNLVLPSYQTLLLEIAGPVATVTLNRPQVMNALNMQVFDDLETAFGMLARDPSVRAILLTGAGDKAFAAGADIAELAGTDAGTGEQKARRGQAVFRMIESCGRPVIACINGFALGGGCELALACTLRLAAETARLGQPEVKLGLLPGYGGTQRLPRLIGRSAALRLLLTGEMVSAGEALRLGLVDEVQPAAGLLDRGRQLAAEIAGQAPLAVRAILEAVDRGAEMPLEEALGLEAAMFGRLCGSADKQEGVDAFLTKRKASWSGK
jgi:enoyl-CoA hydratase